MLFVFSSQLLAALGVGTGIGFDFDIDTGTGIGIGTDVAIDFALTPVSSEYAWSVLACRG